MDHNNNNSIPLPDGIWEAMRSMSMIVGPASNDTFPPMMYKSLQELQQVYQQQNRIVHPLAQDVLATIAKLRTKDHENLNCENEYLSRIATALILLGHGYTDECHDLVSSLSWPNELPFAYGPPIDVQSEEILTLASYVHGLVHRKEGPNSSEFGMTGFTNADYWAGTALRSPIGAEALPLREIRHCILVQANNLDANAWCSKNIESDPDAFPAWDPRLLNELCAMIATFPTTETDPQQQQRNVHLQDFASRAALVEIQVLLFHTLRLMGYHVPA